VSRGSVISRPNKIDCEYRTNFASGQTNADDIRVICLKLSLGMAKSIEPAGKEPGMIEMGRWNESGPCPMTGSCCQEEGMEGLTK
jgi:hypothetical protein